MVAPCVALGAKARRRLSSCGLRGGAKRQCGVGGNEAPAPRGEAARGIEGHRGIWMGDERSYPAWSTFTKSELDNHHFWWENYGKSPFLMGKLWKVTIFNRINKLFLWPFSIAMLNYQRVFVGQLRAFSNFYGLTLQRCRGMDIYIYYIIIIHILILFNIHMY